MNQGWGLFIRTLLVILQRSAVIQASVLSAVLGIFGHWVVELSLANVWISPKKKRPAEPE